MSWTEVALVAVPAAAIIGAVGTVLREKYKPRIDAVTADQITGQVKRITLELNAYRDLRQLDVERWGEKMRPVLLKIRDRDDVMCDAIKSLASRLGEDIPQIPPFPDIPEFPEPRPLPG